MKYLATFDYNELGLDIVGDFYGSQQKYIMLEHLHIDLTYQRMLGNGIPAINITIQMKSFAFYDLIGKHIKVQYVASVGSG